MAVRLVPAGLALLVVVVLAAGCGDGAESAAPADVVVATEAPSPNPAPTLAPSRPSPTAIPTIAPAAATATPTLPPIPTPTPVPTFAASVEPIDAATAERMQPTSWRPGCPVDLADLRRLELVHWGYDGAVHRGELVVHSDWAEPMVGVFAELFAARFPIERMELVDGFGGDDAASIRANNTSAFNCREVAYRPGVWSNHAFGAAIDINPLVNPYVDGGFVDPPEGAAHADRSVDAPGLIRHDDAVTRAFATIGWGWGGEWGGPVDYQHFSASGR